MKTDADESDGTMTMPVTEDAREICFSPREVVRVYASDDDRFLISETPTGAIDRQLATGQVIRVWPDGIEETFPADSPKYAEYPVWPRPIATRRAKGRR